MTGVPAARPANASGVRSEARAGVARSAAPASPALTNAPRVIRPPVASSVMSSAFLSRQVGCTRSCDHYQMAARRLETREQHLPLLPMVRHESNTSFRACQVTWPIKHCSGRDGVERRRFGEAAGPRGSPRLGALSGERRSLSCLRDVSETRFFGRCPPGRESTGRSGRGPSSSRRRSFRSRRRCRSSSCSTNRR